MGPDKPLLLIAEPSGRILVQVPRCLPLHTRVHCCPRARRSFCYRFKSVRPVSATKITRAEKWTGGNAGIAAACAAHALGAQCSVFLPEETTPSTLELLRQYGAQVSMTGHSYFEASQEARKAVSNESKAYAPLTQIFAQVAAHQINAEC